MCIWQLDEIPRYYRPWEGLNTRYVENLLWFLHYYETTPFLGSPILPSCELSTYVRLLIHLPIEALEYLHS